MTKQRTGGVKEVVGAGGVIRRYARVRIGRKKRETITLAACSSFEAATERAALIADVANELLAAGRADKVKDFAMQLGAAESAKVIAAIRYSVARLIVQGARPSTEITVKKFGEQWTGGDLHRLYPDYVRKKKTSDDDARLFDTYVYPLIGAKPISAVTLDDGEDVMRSIPIEHASATRRHVAQVMYRLFRMAVFPCRILEASPLPPGFLPRIKQQKAKVFLYPDEEAKLIRCADIPIQFRMLYGFMAREGTRGYSEAIELRWRELDLERGVVRLDRNKTDDPRSWAMDPSTRRALEYWTGTKTPPPDTVVFLDAAISHPAEVFRKHLEMAGITRHELFETSSVRLPIRLHDLRATFVTVSLANGKSETWVQDRTGHRSTLMIQRYRRSARMFGELSLGVLMPLDELLATAVRGGSQMGQSGSSGSSGEVIQIAPRRRKSRTVARPGLEPGCSCEPRILNRADASSGAENAGGNKRARAAARRAAAAVTQAMTHPEPFVRAAAGVKHLVAEAEVFEVLELEELSAETRAAVLASRRAGGYR